jgi:hypothetical protein
MGQRLEQFGDRRLRQAGGRSHGSRSRLALGMGRQMGRDDNAIIGQLAEDDHRSGLARNIRSVRGWYVPPIGTELVLNRSSLRLARSSRNC